MQWHLCTFGHLVTDHWKHNRSRLAFDLNIFLGEREFEGFQEFEYDGLHFYHARIGIVLALSSG